MKKHYETHVEDTDKLISVAGPVLDYKSWYEQYRKLMEEQAQRKHGLYTPTSEGDDDDFPSITGMIARYSASGLTNEQMAENPVWKDLTGNGHDLQMKNFAWSGMSGIGGYVVDIDEWGTNSTAAYFERNSIKITATFKENASLGLLYHNIKLRQSCVLKVTGIPKGCDAFLDDRLGNRFYMSEDGVYEIIPSNFLAEALYLSIEKYPERWYESKLTIEQLPLYPGALVFDGVDDWAGCDNLPLLPKEKGYSIIALRNWITRYDATQYKRPLISNLDTNDEGAFLIEYRKDENVNDVTGSYNSFTDVYIDDNNPITWQTSSSYNGQIIKKGTSKPSNKLCICKTYFSKNSRYANAAIWELVILDHDATEEELTKIKDYFVKTYPWLFPDQAWTVTGKTNEDEDRATIANITGNGNDLVLSNVAFSENSGYGSYPFGMNVWNPDYIADQPYGTVHYPNDSKSYVTTVKNNATNFRIKFRLRGLPEGGSFLIRVFDMNDLNTALKTYTYTENGIHEFVYNDPNKPARIILYNGNTPSNISEFYLDIIPEYEGYLVTDGVDDKVQSSSYTMNEDWTIVGDWELLSNVQVNCGIVKAQNVYLYNTANGLLISINNPRSLQSFGTKSLHAICSDGRLYDRNWVEYEYTVDQNFEIVKSSLNIGFNLNNYAQIAFKNLGIYDNQLLSKDDCIKAYNYLQTLKAK